MTPWKNNWSFVSTLEAARDSAYANQRKTHGQYLAVLRADLQNAEKTVKKDSAIFSNLVFSSRAFFSVSSKDAGICWVFSSSSAWDGSAALAAL